MQFFKLDQAARYNRAALDVEQGSVCDHESFPEVRGFVRHIQDGGQQREEHAENQGGHQHVDMDFP
ncbi:hypothetical protein SDC9_208015 [bioreactor metagenome]|uniref:Uncharacterized protein n=1 Tax=bioreactor metagenome TaxID=1076179 RepID=A0A645JA67_9ZZZZ